MGSRAQCCSSGSKRVSGRGHWGQGQPALRGRGLGHFCQRSSIAPSRLDLPTFAGSFHIGASWPPGPTSCSPPLPSPPPPPFLLLLLLLSLSSGSQGQEPVGSRGPLCGSASVSWGSPYAGQLRQQKRIGSQSRGAKPETKVLAMPRSSETSLLGSSIDGRARSVLALSSFRVGLRPLLPSHKDTSHAGLEARLGQHGLDLTSDICSGPIFKRGHILRSLGSGLHCKNLGEGHRSNP